MFRWFALCLPALCAALVLLTGGCSDVLSDKSDKSDKKKTDDEKESTDSAKDIARKEAEKLKKVSPKDAKKKEDQDITLAKASNAAGLVAASKGDFASAAKSFARAVELAENAEYYNNLGRCYFWLGRYNESIISLRKAEELGHKNADLYCNLGDTYRMQGNYARMQEAYHKALSLTPNDLRAHYELGHYFLKKGDFKSAEERMNKVLQIDPGFNKALLDRLIVYRITGRYELAYNDMLTLDRRGFDIKDELRDQILDGVKKQKEAEAQARADGR